MSAGPVPNAARAIGTPGHLRGLLERSGQSQAEVARAIGIDARTFRRYLSGEVRIPYLVEFAVECATRAVRYESRNPLGEVPPYALRRMRGELQATVGKASPASYARRRAHNLIGRIDRELARRAAVAK